VESVHGAGATFIAMIPTEGRRALRQTRSLSNERNFAQSGRWSVLVVEDEESLLRSLAGALRHRFHVLLAADGQEALDLLVSGSKPDLILCDLGLPVVSGFQLYDWLERNRPDLARRIVFMTANASDPSARKFIAAVGRPLMEKPITKIHLLSVLDRLALEGGGIVPRIQPSSDPSRGADGRRTDP